MTNRIWGGFENEKMVFPELNCHVFWAWSSKLSCKISRRYDQPFSGKLRLKLLFWPFSGYSRTEIVTSVLGYGRPDVTLEACTSCRATVLVQFCKRKTRGETQFWIELAAPCTFANHKEINANDRLPFIIFLTPVFCDCSNHPWRQRLLLTPSSLCRHQHTLYGVIRPQAGGKCGTFRRVIERYRFHRYLCFHCVFCMRIFCILFCTNRVTKSY